MHPATHAKEHPGKPAYIMGRTGDAPPAWWLRRGSVGIRTARISHRASWRGRDVCRLGGHCVRAGLPQ